MKYIIFILISGLLIFNANAQQSKLLRKAEKAHRKALSKKSVEERDKAAAMYLEVINQNTPEKSDAYRGLGELYSHHSPVEIQDLSKSMEYYQIAASTATDPKVKALSYYNLGLFYYRGKPVERDYAKAKELFRQAASLNEKHYIALAEMYELGLDQEVNLGKAMEFYYRAAIEGNTNSWTKIFNLKYIADCIAAQSLDSAAYQDYQNYLMEISVNDNTDESMKYLHKSSRRGYVPAFFELSSFLMKPKYQNFDDAMHWLETAAEKGYAPGMNNYGAYTEAKKMNQMTPVAFDWFLKASQNGFPVAFYAVGWYYQHGQVKVAKNPAIARAYYLQSVVQGNSRGQEGLNGLFVSPNISFLGELPAELKNNSNPFYSISDLLSDISHQFPPLNTTDDPWGSGDFWAKRYADMEKWIKEECEFCQKSLEKKNMSIESFGENKLQISSFLIASWQKDMAFFRKMASQYGKDVALSAYETKGLVEFLK